MTDKDKMKQDQQENTEATVTNDSETCRDELKKSEGKETSEVEERTVADQEVDATEEEKEMDEKDKRIKELEQLVEKLQEENSLLRRAAADLQNRNRQQEIDLKYAESGLIRNLLVPLSYFEGALNVKTEDETLQNFLKGFEMIYNLLFEQLYQRGLKEIKVEINEPFDPKVHEVFELVDSQESDGLIVSLVQKGYYFKDRVIKPAKVRVTRLVQNDDESSTTDSLEESLKEENSEEIVH